MKIDCNVVRRQLFEEPLSVRECSGFGLVNVRKSSALGYGWLAEPQGISLECLSLRPFTQQTPPCYIYVYGAAREEKKLRICACQPIRR